jgi:hypothetical protein
VVHLSNPMGDTFTTAAIWLDAAPVLDRS